MHIFLTKPPLITCPKCGRKKLSHAVCPHCGSYKEREVVDVLEKLTKKDRKERKKEIKDREREKKPLTLKELSKK